MEGGGSQDGTSDPMVTIHSWSITEMYLGGKVIKGIKNIKK